MILNTPESPFLVITDFISNLQCETIVDDCGFVEPDVDVNGHPITMSIRSTLAEQIILDATLDKMPIIESHFKVSYASMEPIYVEWVCGKELAPKSGSHSNIEGKWMRVNRRDFTVVLFLCDYNKEAPFDQEFEVYGGKLEFIQYGFGFNPQRGTAVVFPSNQHFLNATAPVLQGELFQARVHITTTTPFQYDNNKVVGDYSTWFRE
jgi:hypothetical protein